MKPMHSFVAWVIGVGTGVVCRIEDAELELVPRRGPLILAVNHINSLDAPLLLAHLQPRRMRGLAKIETWDNKFMGWLFNLWESIPIRRGEADLEAVRRCLNALESGDILAVAPEGTRTYDGRLISGRPGIVLIALRSGAPILPVAHWGGEDFSKNIKRLKRTDFHIRVGKPFILDSKGEKVNGKIRQEMVDEIMLQIASLMPEEYRGQYAYNTLPPQKYLQFS
jgi:1-acyl-sn-glycerol-3-phosphate acyltransferase